VLVRPLKREHFDLARSPDMLIYWRRRGDTTYRRLTAPDYASLREEFAKAGRANLLEVRTE